MVPVLQDLGREGADPRTSGNFYKAVVQATLLFGPETWMMTPRDREDPCRITPKVRPPYGGNKTNTGHDGTLGIPAYGRDDGGSGAREGGEICPPPPYHR